MKAIRAKIGSRLQAGGAVVSSFLMGLSAASLLFADCLARPRVPNAGIAADWSAVGRDIKAATRRYEARDV